MASAMDLPLEAAPQERYIFKPLCGSSHFWALQQLKGRVAGTRVLDIGAGGGGIGRSIRPEKPAQLVAIEIDLRAQLPLQELYDEVHGDLSPLKGRQFDTIILLDVLEHMSDPFAFLSRVQELLAPNGLIIISVPNVAHWSVRFPLFFCGRFEYRSRGILDRTHLQFFSRRRFLDLCSALAGCRIERLSASIEPVELILPTLLTANPIFSALSRCRSFIAELLPGLMGYQHLALLKHRSATESV